MLRKQSPPKGAIDKQKQPCYYSNYDSKKLNFCNEGEAKNRIWNILYVGAICVN